MEIKATRQFEKLIRKRDNLDERKQRVKERLEELKDLREGERVKPSFFHRMKLEIAKEEI